MGDPSKRIILPSSGGVFDNIGFRIRLIIRLMKDHRVSPLVKILPIAALIYLFAPDLAPGPIDDVAVLWLGGFLFIELCPPEVVQEHVLDMTAVIEGEWREVDDPPPEPEGS